MSVRAYGRERERESGREENRKIVVVGKSGNERVARGVAQAVRRRNEKARTAEWGGRGVKRRLSGDIPAGVLDRRPVLFYEWRYFTRQTHLLLPLGWTCPRVTRRVPCEPRLSFARALHSQQFREPRGCFASAPRSRRAGRSGEPRGLRTLDFFPSFLCFPISRVG